MIANKKNIIILVSVIAAMIIGIVIVLNIDTSTTAPETKEQYTVYNAASAEIESVCVGYGENTVKAVQENGEWTIEGYGGADVDTGKVSGLVNSLTPLISEHKITDDTSQLSEYGLDAPDITISVTKKSGGTDIISIGDMSPTLGEYFVKTDKDSAVYTVSNTKISLFTQPISYYREFNRFSVNIDDITGIKLVSGSSVTELKILDNIDSNTNNVWEMLSPYTSGANDDYIDDKLLAPIGKITLSTPVEKTDEMFGDNSVQVTLTLKPYDDSSHKYGKAYTENFTVGNTDGDKTFVEYKGRVFAENAENVDFVHESAFNLVSKLQALVDISKVKSVEITMGSTSNTLETVHDGADIAFKLNGKNTDDELSRNMYKAIISLAVDGIYNNEPLGETFITFNFKGIKREDDTKIEFKSADNLNYALVKNGKAEFTIKKSKVDELEKLWHQYLDEVEKGGK